jgi:NADPH-dependent curcumin reductase CurA
LQDGQVLVRHHYLSLDPYMRGRMNDSKSYAQPQPLGQVMIGGTVGEVVESRNAKFAVGDKVVGMGGWQEYSVVDAHQRGALRKVDTTHVPLSHYLGAVGMPGVTAWYGLVKIIEPKAARRWWSAPPPAPWAAPSARWPRRAAARCGHCRRPGQMQIRGQRAGL